MARSNPYVGFEVDALKAILDAAGIKYPSDVSQETLADMVKETEKVLGKDGFVQIVASLNNVKAQAPSTKSLNPGTSILWTLLNGIGGVTSETWDPPTPLEYGRTLT